MSEMSREELLAKYKQTNPKKWEIKFGANAKIVPSPVLPAYNRAAPMEITPTPVLETMEVKDVGAGIAATLSTQEVKPEAALLTGSLTGAAKLNPVAPK